MSYRVIFDRKVVKDMKALPKDVQQRIVQAIESKLAVNPYLGKRLAGDLSDFYLYRVGCYRIIYLIDDDRIVIEIVKVGHRQSVYHH